MRTFPIVLPVHSGIVELYSSPGRRSEMNQPPPSTARAARPFPNGYLHAAATIALADKTWGYGTFTDLPDGAQNFTTIELKSNFLDTAREGSIACVATIVHRGRTTQIWDAQATDESNGKMIALFRCTQLILYPR
jgi:uncharacterized protein (TIGR00369 family)